MGVTIAAAGHHESLASVIDDLGLTFLNKDLGSSLVANIDVLTILHSEGFNNLIVVGSENLAIDHEVGSWFTLTAGQNSHCAAKKDGCKHP